MRIAVTHKNGEVFQHFGHSPEFKIYETDKEKIIRSDVVGANGSGHGALVEILSVLKVQVLICGGIGGGAQTALDRAGIKLYGGVKGNADRAVESFIAEKLDYDPEVKCDSQGSGHEHNCGEHSCTGGECK